jgi:hypothetical protein
VTAQVVPPATAREERTVLAAGIYRGAAGTGALLVEAEVLADLTGPTHGRTAVGDRRAWDLAAAAVVAVEVAGAAVEVAAVEAAGADKLLARAIWIGAQEMKLASPNPSSSTLVALRALVLLLCLPGCVLAGEEQPASIAPQTFQTPQQAADALVDAATQFDERALEQIFGSAGNDIIFSGDYADDRQRAADFAAQAHEMKRVSLEPKSGTRAFLLVGKQGWPFPIPIVKTSGGWFFDAKAGQKELLYRRIGNNERDAIAICRGFVDAQYDYALKPREGYDVNQFAQRIVSSPGKQDGLAWQGPDGTWQGPIGKNIAKAIEEGYSQGTPYHGYFFKVLKGQGPAAPLGELDYLVNGMMIGGFALAAAPAEYRVTGVKTFMVSQDGVVYQKDLGPSSLSQFSSMERFNPDSSWTPVGDE